MYLGLDACFFGLRLIIVIVITGRIGNGIIGAMVVVGSVSIHHHHGTVIAAG
jgi:hypothetical protein